MTKRYGYFFISKIINKIDCFAANLLISMLAKVFWMSHLGYLQRISTFSRKDFFFEVNFSLLDLSSDVYHRKVEVCYNNYIQHQHFKEYKHKYVVLIYGEGVLSLKCEAGV